MTLDESIIKPLANSDAYYAGWVDVKSLKKDDMAFDHFDIISYVVENDKPELSTKHL